MKSAKVVGIQPGIAPTGIPGTILNIAHSGCLVEVKMLQEENSTELVDFEVIVDSMVPTARAIWSLIESGALAMSDLSRALWSLEPDKENREIKLAHLGFALKATAPTEYEWMNMWWVLGVASFRIEDAKADNSIFCIDSVMMLEPSEQKEQVQSEENQMVLVSFSTSPL